jgi:lysozyme
MESPSQACYSLVKSFEGCRLIAYQDGNGVWTIGYGHTGNDVTEGLMWIPAQAAAALTADINRAWAEMDSLVTVELSQGQVDALTDFTFNEGSGRLRSSTLLKCINAGLFSEVPAQILRWDYIGCTVSAGLAKRRAAEIELWEKS